MIYTPVPGVRTLVLPMGGPMATVNVHLVELEQGYLLVDSGMGTAECLAALESSLAECGLAWAGVRTLLLTHLHPDHVGHARHVLDRSGARLLMHRIDAHNLAVLSRAGRSPFFEEAWKLAGIPSVLRERLDLRLAAHPRPPVPAPHLALEGGERIAIRGGTLEAVWTPGHSAGHVCLYCPEQRYLIAGDHLLEHITPNIGWRPGQDMLAQYLDSLRLIERLEVDWVLPSHGPAFRNHRKRIQEIIDHHQQRCDRILEHISVEPLTAHALVERIWQANMSSFAQHLAVLEILAHLEYLRRRGPMTVEPLPEGAIAWHRAA